jgi:hypothetical protein
LQWGPINGEKPPFEGRKSLLLGHASSVTVSRPKCHGHDPQLSARGTGCWPLDVPLLSVEKGKRRGVLARVLGFRRTMPASAIMLGGVQSYLVPS